jgi:hypothetical protein
VYKTKRKYQGEPIRTDPTCDPKENETALHFSGGDRYAWVSSYEESVVTGLLAHPDFKILELVLMRIERKDSVVGVVGRIPIAALRIGNSRGSNEHALVIPPILKDKLFSATVEDGKEKALSRNGKSVKKTEKTKLPLLKPKSEPKVTAKTKNGKNSSKEPAARPSQRGKKKTSDKQLSLIPLALSSKDNSKKKRISKKSLVKASVISSRSAKALKPLKAKPVKLTSQAKSEVKAQSKKKSVRRR